MNMVAALLPFALLCGCGNPYPTTYSIGIAGFSPHDTALIVDAIHRWEDGVGDKSVLSVAIHYGDCDANNNGDTCIIPASLATSYIKSACSNGDLLGCTAYEIGTEVDDQYPVIIIETDAIAALGDSVFGSNDVLFRQVAEHEIGHSMGLMHSNQKTVMNPNAQNASSDITCFDLQQFFSLRGISKSCESVSK